MGEHRVGERRVGEHRVGDHRMNTEWVSTGVWISFIEEVSGQVKGLRMGVLLGVA